MQRESECASGSERACGKEDIAGDGGVVVVSCGAAEETAAC